MNAASLFVTLLGAIVVAGCASPTVAPTAQQIPSAAPATATIAVSPSPSPQEMPITSPDQSSKYDLLSRSCRHGECLLSRATERDYPIGVATLRGYYARVERSGREGTILCDSFTVVGGNQDLIHAFLTLIAEGNAVNAKNELDQPVISLDLSALSESEKQKLLASSAQDPIDLIVLALSPLYHSVGACYSPVEILKVDSANGAPAIPLQQLGFKGQTFWTRIKNKEYSVIISYPSNWYLDPHSDASLTFVQNVAPFNNPAEVPGGLPEGFAKFSFMIDPNANQNALQGEEVTINGVTWYRQVASGELAGDRTTTLETVHGGLVYRIHTYITGTGGQGPIFDYQAAILDQMIQSVRFGQ